MKRVLLILALLALFLTGCSLVIEDTPELREHYAAKAEGLPVPPLPCLDILGNVASNGELIYHMQGQANYNNVKPEAYFCTEAEAEAAGYRKALR